MHTPNSTTPESERDSAQTRWEDIRHLENILGGNFILDACALPGTAKAARWYGLLPGGEFVDGLSRSWCATSSGVIRPMVYCNPPFSDPGPWFEKAINESRNITVVGCCKHDESTRWWQQYVEQATFIIIPTDRRTFLRPDGSEFRDRHGKLAGPAGMVVFPVWTMPRVQIPARIRIEFPKIRRAKDKRRDHGHTED